MSQVRPSLLLRPGIDRCRLAIGLAVSSGCRLLRGALVAGTGRGLEMRLEVAASISRPIPRRIVAGLRALGGPAEQRQPARAPLVAAELAEFEAIVVDELLAQQPRAVDRALAIGVTDPGQWARSRGGLVGYRSLCDASRLADLTGQNVIDSFPARDLAQEGRGGPLGPLPDWLLLHHPTKTRALVDLGPELRVSYLPASRDTAGAERLTALPALPGLRLVDRFARALTGGSQAFDDGGHLAVGGSRIAEVIDAWHAELARRNSVVSFVGSARAPATTPLFEAAMALAAGRWSVRDLLCTATHFVAELAVNAITAQLPAAVAIDETIVCGGGQHNGLLIRAIGERMGEQPLVPLADLGLSAEARDPAIAAALALLHLDQTPACPTGITGARTPRVLGALTPGSPQAWQRLLREMTQQPSVVSLRSAI